MKAFYTFVFLLFISLACSKVEPTIEEITQTPFSFQQEFTIGGQENPDEPYIFSSINSIVTDSKNNIYLGDNGLKVIRLFSSEGVYKKDIGRSGRGPGEYLDASVFSMNQRDELTLFDSHNSRITTFNSSTNAHAHFSITNKEYPWPVQARFLANQEFVGLKKYDLPGLDIEEPLRTIRSSVFHTIEGPTFNRITSFGHPDTLIDQTEDFIRLHTNKSPGHIWASQNKLWYAPELYNGYLYQFGNNTGEWILTKKIKGKTVLETPVELNISESETKGVTTLGIFVEGGPYRGFIQMESLGIYELSDKRIIHFTRQLINDSRKVMIELFSPEGKLEKYGELEGFDSMNRRYAIAKIWKDHNDRFYIIDRRDIQMLRVGTIDGL